MVGHQRMCAGVMFLKAFPVSQGSIISSIGYGINAIISAIAAVIETIVGAIVAVRTLCYHVL
jgi:hypothetical protein